MEESRSSFKGIAEELVDLRGLMEVETRLDLTIGKKQTRAVTKLDALIVETFKQKIEMMTKKDKTIQQHKKAKKPLRILCEKTWDYFKEATVTIKKLLFLIRNNHSFLVDLTMHMGSFMKGMQPYCEHLMDTFTKFFFDDFGSVAHTQHDFHRFVYAMIDRITSAPDPLRAYDSSLLMRTLTYTVMSRDEVVQFAKDLFSNAKIEVREEEHYDSFYSAAALSPTKRATTGMPTERKTMIGGPAAVQIEPDSAADLETAVKEAEKIIRNLMHFVDLIPLSLRYFCKMIVEILGRKCGEGFTEVKMKSIIADIMIMKVIMPALLDPIEYDVVLDCVVSDSYHKVAANVGKILKAIVMGNPFGEKEPLGMYANKLVLSVQEDVKKYIKELLCFELPNYDGDYGNRAGEIVMAEGMCMSLLNLQLIFDLVVHNYRYYLKKYPAIGPIMNRLLYHENQDHLFMPKRELLRSVPPSLSADEFTQSYKYFIFTDVKIKAPEIAAPQLTQAPAESQQIIKILKHMLCNIDMTNYKPNVQSSDIFKEYLETIHDKTLLFCPRKEDQVGLRLDVDYLLKLYTDGLFKTQFLQELRSYLYKKNQDAQEKLNSLAIQHKKTYEYVTLLISNARQKVEEDCQHVLHRVKAAEYMRIYRKKFAIVTTENPAGGYVFTIRFPYEEQEESSPDKSKARVKKGKQENFPEKIDEFIKDLLMFSEIKDLISTGNDDQKIGEIYKQYMERVHTKLLNDENYFKDFNMDDREKVFEQVETHIAFGLYSSAYPKTPSSADTTFRTKMKCLQWIDPTCLGIRKDDLKVDYWRTAAKEIANMEDARTPMQKLSCLTLCVNIINQGLMKFSTRKEAPGADDLLPMFIYVLVMAAPSMIYSNLNYIAAFRDPGMMDESSYCFTQINTAVQYLETFGHENVGIPKEEFDKRMEEEARKERIQLDVAGLVFAKFQGKIRTNA